MPVLTNAAKKAKEMIEGAMAWAKQCRELGFPAQAGSLSQDQFKTFYWPTLRKLIPDHCHRGLCEKMVTDRKAKLKKQRQL